jgi:O-acetyl-ADP-ribose deacetylase (regulator of RNase III)
MARESLWGRTVIRIVMGDITLYDGDAVVNAANNEFWMGAGVAGAIKRKGGQAIETEAMAGGPVSPGEVRVTGAGRLDVRFVLHAAVMAQDLVTSEPFIRLATRNALVRADEVGAARIAFPALGTGVGGFPIADCARAMLKEIHLYLSETSESKLREIVFFLFGEETAAVFGETLERFAERESGKA